MIIEGNCKVNLALNVEGILPNGYHSVKLIMQEITLSDEISLDFGEGGVSLSCSDSAIPTDSRNIAYRAAELFYSATGIDGGVHIHIDKRIPSEAGLGGGSVDGAAVLRGMNDYYGEPLTDGELISIAAKLGADVPFFIIGGTALCEGIGEIMTPIDSKLKSKLLIVKPVAGMSTPVAYKMLDESPFEPVDVDRVIECIESGDEAGLCASMGNVFEQVAESLVPEVSDIKAELVSLGAKAAMMSGSGTAVFGIFADDDSRDNAYEELSRRYDRVFKAETV